jgi:DHA1 family tetracycline resistance protein-like MFS transporter
LTIGISLMVVGICTAAISGGLTGRMVKRFGEKVTLCTGQFCGAVGMCIAGLARTGSVFMASVPIISMWNVSFPAAQGLMSHRVGEREQGELQGALQSLRSITFIIGPVLFSQVFSWFIDPKHGVHLPGAPYYLAAAMLFSAMLMATRIKQPDFTARSTSTVEPAELAPPETISSGPVAPVLEPEENI